MKANLSQSTSDAAHAGVAPPVPKREGLWGRGRRISGYFSWHALATFLNQGIPQLVLFPLCLHLIGKEEFGKFVYALGMVRIVNLAPTRGLINTLLRNIAGIANERRGVLIRTAFVLALCVVGGIALPAILACLGVWGFGGGGAKVPLWTAILVLAIAAHNIILVTTADLAVKRRFAHQALWQCMGGVLSLVALPGVLLMGSSGVPAGYTLGYVVALALLLIVRRETLIGKPQFDKGMARSVATLWVILSVSALFIQSGLCIHRTLLGAFGSYEMVSVFFAAAATLTLFAVPFSELSGFGVQLLSAHASKRTLPQRVLRWYPVAALGGAVLLYGLLIFLAPWVVHLLYPAVADSALKVLSIMAPGVAISVLLFASKPYVVKFSPRRAMVVIGIVSFLSHLGSALLLIPRWGLVGAAWAFSIGMTMSSLTWFGFLIAGIRRPVSDQDLGGSVDNLDADWVSIGRSPRRD